MKSKMNTFIIGIFSVIGMIFLGGFSNGVWEHIEAPILTNARNIILSIVTFGINGYKNDIYMEIAKGFTEKCSVTLLILFLLSIGSLAIITLILRYTGKLLIKGANSEKFRRNFDFFNLLYSIFFIAFTFIYILRIQYINDAITHFRQMYSIVSPYIQDGEKEKLIARFAQIKTKSDYLNIITVMKSDAQKNKQSFPEFKVW